jgi:hypothetical protein
MGAKIHIAFLTQGIDQNTNAGPIVFQRSFIKLLCLERRNEFEGFFVSQLRKSRIGYAKC